MRKRLVGIVILLCQLFVLTGCWDAVEIDQMQLVSSIALDKGEDGQKYHLSAEIVTLDSGSTEPSKSEQTSKIVEASADTIFEATRKIISTTGRKLYYGHCKNLIISEDLAREGIVPILDIWMRFLSSRITVDIMIAKEVDAVDILKQDSVRKSPNGFELESLLKSDREHLARTKRMELYAAVNELGTPGIDLALPAVTVEKKDHVKSMYKVDGMAVFSQDKLVGYVDGEQTKYFLMIKNLMRGGPLSVEVEKDRFVSIQFMKIKSKVDFSEEDDRLTFFINSKFNVTLAEFGTANEFEDDKDFPKLNKLIESKIEQDMEKFVRQVQEELGCDIFGFGKLIHEEDPELWEKYKDDWAQTFPEVEVAAKAEVKIINQGTTSKEIVSVK